MRTGKSYVEDSRRYSYDAVALSRQMANRRDLSRAAAVAGLVGAGAALAQRRHMRSIADDPERAILEQPIEGQPLSIRSADGTELHAEAFGREEQPTLVLIHGWTETLRIWVYVIRALERDFRIVAYDLRGHGGSGRSPSNDYSIERFGEDVEAVLAATLRDGERALVAGHSLGGMSIVAWAEHHDVSARASGAGLLFTGVGELVAGQLLIPVPVFARALAEPVARVGFLGNRAPLPRMSTPVSHAVIRHVAFGPTATPAQVAFLERMAVSCPPDVRAAAGLATADLDLHHALPRLTLPTLVMAGLDDRLTPPSHARRVAAELPNLQALIELPDTGHMGPLERPSDVASALRDLAHDAAAVGPAVSSAART
jgi:pimeloyl-ACP methyl ester carboxylesterase